MTKIAYIEKRFSKGSLALIAQANEIIGEYANDNLKLTLRQLYYQFVSRDLLPNQQKEYKKLGNVISDARLAGMIDWESIEDRTRNLTAWRHHDNPGDAISDAYYYYNLDKWKTQDYRPEVWIEKEALVGVISRICSQLDIPYFACRGYVSQSEMWSAARRMREYQEDGQTPVIIHLGDHDPSGMDMTRDIVDRQDLFGSDIILERIALNFDQIEEYAPPPNPAKLTDSRASGYISEYGSSSWELDALEPTVIRSLIKDTVEKYIDDDALEVTEALEKKHKKILRYVMENWEDLDIDED